MLLRKLRAGVLHVVNPYGLRCIRLTLSERIILIWTFRHFTVLPDRVLSARGKRLLDNLLNGDRPIERCSNIHLDDNDVVIGTLDCMDDQKKPAKGTRWKSSVPVTNSTRP